MIRATATFRPRSSAGQFVAAVITPAVLASVQAGAGVIQQAAQGYCPVDTGALRDSITIETSEGESTASARVGPHMPYADFVEYGTGVRGAGSPGAGKGPYSSTWPGMVAQPYMRPAFDENKEPIKDLFRSNLATSLR